MMRKRPALQSAASFGIGDVPQNILDACLRAKTVLQGEFGSTFRNGEFSIRANTPHSTLSHLFHYLFPKGNALAFNNSLPVLKTAVDKQHIQNSLSPILYPYQRDAVDWMVHNEKQSRKICFFWEKVEDFYIHRLDGILSTTPPTSLFHLQGAGLLCDVMGLGKSLEIISLILAHPYPASPSCADNQATISSPCTLIVSPSSIATQWLDEIKKHAPFLSVLFFTKDMLDQKRNEINPRQMGLDTEWDIVLVTYDVLGKEIHRARDDNSRTRRFKRAYTRPKSFFLQINWWRICLDEAQMARTNTNPGETAKLIPARNRWCVTGTPTGKHGLEDLVDIFTFLSLTPFLKQWPAVKLNLRLHPEIFIPTFLENLRWIAYRNTKESVSDQLVLPDQQITNYTLAFSKIERSAYDTILSDAFSNCVSRIREDAGCDDLEENYGAELRMWVYKLRKACVHVQLADAETTAANRFMSIMEVLESTIKKAVVSLLSLHIESFALRVKIAHTYEHQKLDILAANEIYINDLGDIRATIQKYKHNPDRDPTEKGAEFLNLEDPFLEPGRKSRWNRMIHERIFRIAENLHTMYNEQGDETATPDEIVIRIQKREERDKLYEEAQEIRSLEIRRFVLRVRDHVDLLKRKIRATDSKILELGTFDDRGDISIVGVCNIANERLRGGILTSILFEDLEELMEKMDQGWKSIIDFRHNLKELLVSEVVESEDHRAEGNEYELGLKAQKLSDTLSTVFQQALRDRRELLTGNRTPGEVMPNDASPEEQSIWEILAEIKHNGRSLHELIGELKRLSHLENVADAEKMLAFQGVAAYKQVYERQVSLLNLLDGEVSTFTNMFNSRVTFYKSLQEFSDDVAEAPDFEGQADEMRESFTISLNETRAKLFATSARLSYLLNLRGSGDGEDEGSVISECGICREEFTYGILLSCGHRFCCDSDINRGTICSKWIVKNKRCPMCNQATHRNAFTRISSDPASLVKNVLTTAIVPAPSASLLAIQSQSIDGSYGTKFDAIIKHIKMIRTNDPNVKVLIFSRWTIALTVLANGLERNGILHTSFEKDKAKSVQKFKDDASICVFMLSAQKQSSGLTLTCATHCFLVEPLMNMALEAQAINRIHRIGQTNQTFVHRYLIWNSMEDRIMNLSTKVSDDVASSNNMREEFIVWEDMIKLFDE